MEDKISKAESGLAAEGVSENWEVDASNEDPSSSQAGAQTSVSKSESVTVTIKTHRMLTVLPL